MESEPLACTLRAEMIKNIDRQADGRARTDKNKERSP